MLSLNISKRALTALAMAVPLVCASGLAVADPITGTNTRPVPIDAPSFGPSMQQMLDSTFGAGLVNAVTDQSNAAMWATSALPPAATVAPHLSFEYLCAGSDCSSTNFQTFGLFSATDTSGPISLAPIFNGPAVAGANAFLDWLDADTVQITGLSPGVTTGLFNGITRNNFGFYYQYQGDPTRLYSYDGLNPTGSQTQAAMLAYQRAPGSDTWLLAFDANASPFQSQAAGTLDYNDMVVKIESITPVPEPETYAMLGAGLLLMGFVARRRQKRSDLLAA